MKYNFLIIEYQGRLGDHKPVPHSADQEFEDFLPISKTSYTQLW